VAARTTPCSRLGKRRPIYESGARVGRHFRALFMAPDAPNVHAIKLRKERSARREREVRAVQSIADFGGKVFALLHLAVCCGSLFRAKRRVIQEVISGRFVLYFRSWGFTMGNECAAHGASHFLYRNWIGAQVLLRPYGSFVGLIFSRDLYLFCSFLAMIPLKEYLFRGEMVLP
jgi:hypothetical protein